MLTSQQIRELSLALPQATFELKEEWGSELGRIAGKMFLMYGYDNKQRRILTVKVDPQEGIRLRSMYKEWMVEGYYMNKVHWISILLDQARDDELIRTMIHESYQLVFKALPKKVRDALHA